LASDILLLTVFSSFSQQNLVHPKEKIKILLLSKYLK
jgi:hypothetical protein